MEGDMESSFPEVDLDTYQTTLEEVLTWLLSAEDTLQIQDEVSDDVEEVKDQFHTHEVQGGISWLAHNTVNNTMINTCMQGQGRHVLQE